MVAEGSLRTISLAEVEQHNFQNDPKTCWIVMEGKVYDVTNFLMEHPGGEEVITEMAGKDATIAFNDVGHSRDAKEMAKDYLIGVLANGEAPAAPKAEAKPVIKPAAGNSIADILLSPTWTNFLIPTAIGIAVYVLYKAAIRVIG